MPDDKTYTQMRNEFQEKFFKEISPIIRQFEQERIKNLIISIVFTIIFSILCVAIFMFTALKMNTGLLQNCLGIVGFYIGYLAFATIPYTKKYFENSIKSEIMPLICSCYGNLTWTNETKVVKQSISSMLSIFLGLILVGIIVGLSYVGIKYLQITNITIYLVAITILFLFLDAVSIMVLKNKGTKLFYKLSC